MAQAKKQKPKPAGGTKLQAVPHSKTLANGKPRPKSRNK